MKRRDVMKLGAVTAGAGLGVPGCAIPRMLASLAGLDGAKAFNAMLDEQLAAVEGRGFIDRWLAADPTIKPRSPAVAAKIAEKDALFRRMMSTLLVSQSFRDLPPETQQEPAVQDRMWRHMDQIGETVFEVSDMLASLDERQRSQLQRALHDRPDLPMTIGEALDDRCARAGVSPKRRLQLRSMMAQSAFRLRHGDPGSIIDEYVAKVERVRASCERDALTLDLAEKIGERAFWRQQHLLAQQGLAPPAAPAGAPSPSPPGSASQPAARGGDEDGEVPPGPPPRKLARDRVGDPDPNEPSTPPPKEHAGEGGLRAAGYLLGIGFVVGGISLALVNSNAVFVVGLTIGAILFAIGLLVLLVSALVYATSAE